MTRLPFQRHLSCGYCQSYKIVKMTKQIEDYTVDELSAKIEAIKAERERTANALKKYEEELERINFFELGELS